MDKEKLKDYFFFMSGIYCILIWNTLINGTDFFVQSHNNPNISQEYTFYWFLMVLVSVPLYIYLEQSISIFLLWDFSSWILFLFTNLLYVTSIYIEPGTFKNFTFDVCVMGLSVCSTIASLSGLAVCSRFKQNEIVLFAKGKAFSGLTANIFMIFSMVTTVGASSLSLYRNSMVITNIFTIVFLLIFQRTFFKLCKENQYQMIDDCQDHQLEMLEIQSIDTVAEDQNINYSDKTIPYQRLLNKKFQFFLAIFINFAHTLFIYPVLVFKLHFNIADQYKYIYIALIFNIGDYLGRHYYPIVEKYMSERGGHFLNLFKISLTFYNLKALKSTNPITTSFIMMSLYILLLSAVNGILFLINIEYSR